MPLPPLAATLAGAAVLVAGSLAVARSAPPPDPGVAGSVPPAAPSLRPPVPPAVPPVRSAARFHWPLMPVPRVLRPFSVGPYRWSPGHRGVDLAAVAGRTVLSAGPGVVAFAGRVAGRGVVVVAHEGLLRTTYEPVRAGVRRGQRTTAGTPIGSVEQVRGHCPGPCLHWGALRGDTYVDPLSLLGPARLPVLLPDVEALS